MSIFGSILNKLTGHGSAPTAQPAPTTDPFATPVSAPAADAPPPASVQATPLAAVDIEAVLADMAAKAPGGGGNYKVSIVDLLHLLGLDSSLAARTELGHELGVHAGPDGSAEQNIALHKAVMAKVAENGGKVPDSMRG